MNDRQTRRQRILDGGRPFLMRLVNSRNMSGADAESAVSHYMLGRRGADGRRVERIVEAYVAGEIQGPR